jgi:glycine dehydrogenase subunit 1
MYAPHTQTDIREMLDAVGVDSLEELLRVPDAVALKEPLAIPPGLPELELQRTMLGYAGRNGAIDYVSFLGAGAYRHYVPPVVPAIAMRGEFLTAYTPYQAEVSQGYLQAIYEWQSYVCLLTGLDLANASVYDGAILVSAAVHPNYRGVLRTYARGLDLDVEELPISVDGRTDFASLEARLADKRFAALVVQNPNFLGSVDVPDDDVRHAVEASGTVLIGVVAEAMSLGALVAPGTWGAHIAVGEGQSFGVAMAYGGPHVGFIAASKEHMRRIPGRLVGRTVDVHGKPAYTLTLQAREQHIRREKATSNICTNQAHCALCATVYLAAVGATGLRRCATLNVERAHALAERVTSVAGFERRFEAPVFNELAIRVPSRTTAAAVLVKLRERKILGGLDLGRWYPQLADCMLVTATELTTDAEIEQLAGALGAAVKELDVVRA